MNRPLKYSVTVSTDKLSFFFSKNAELASALKDPLPKVQIAILYIFFCKSSVPPLGHENLWVPNISGHFLIYVPSAFWITQIFKDWTSITQDNYDAKRDWHFYFLVRKSHNLWAHDCPSRDCPTFGAHDCQSKDLLRKMTPPKSDEKWEKMF